MDNLTIDSIRFYQYRLPLLRSFYAGGQEVAVREGVILQCVSSQGHVGFGDAAPFAGLSQESLKKVLHQCQYIKADWCGHHVPLTLAALKERCRRDIDRTLLVPSVVFAIESALFQMAAAARGVSVAEFLGQAIVGPLSSACLIQGDVLQVRAFGAKYAAEGFRVFKLKVGSRNIPLDIQKVMALKDALPFSAIIRLDANRAWSLQEALTFGQAIGNDRIDLIEDPCQRLEDLLIFSQKTDLPLALEADACPCLPEALASVRGLKALIVKPAVREGVMGTLDLLAQLKPLGINVIISSAFESAIGQNMLANLAALTAVPCGLGPALWFAEDLMVPPSLLAPDGTIDPARLTLRSLDFVPQLCDTLVP